MHELAVCQALLSEVETVARQHAADRATRITLRVGPLSGVVPELLQRTFSVARTGTVARSAELVIEPAPVRVLCNRCGSESAALPNRLLCASCGDFHTTVISGEELLLARVELASETAADRAPTDEPVMEDRPYV